MQNDEEHRVANGSIDWSAMTERLRRQIQWPTGTQLRDVDVCRVWARRGGRIAFELALTIARGDATSTVFLQGGVDESKPPAHPHTRAKIGDGGLRGLRLHDACAGAWYCTPDRDPKLRIARRLLNPATLGPWLQTSGVGSETGDESTGAAASGRLTVELMAYRAGKRCVIRVRPTGGTNPTGVFLKAFRRPPSGRQIDRLRGLAAQLEAKSGGAVRVPPVVAFLPEDGVLVTREIPRAAGAREDSSIDSNSAALVLSTLHRADPKAASNRHTPADELQTVARWLQVLPRICESDLSFLRSVAEALGRRAASIDEPLTTPIHRDYYDAQLLRVGNVIWLVDFDTLCLGHAELDVATYIAHLVLDGLCAEGAQTDLTGKASQFLGAYQTRGGHLSVRRLGFYLSAALARLGALHLARSLPIECVHLMWNLAHQALHTDPNDGNGAAQWLTRVTDNSKSM